MRASLIVGAGPGGIGPVIWAAQQGVLKNWLRSGVAIFDRQSSIGGTLGRYAINSDSLGGAYLECLDAPAGRAFFDPMRNDPATQELSQLRDGFPSLNLVSRYLGRLGSLLESTIGASPGCSFNAETDVQALHLQADGTVIAEAKDARGRRSTIEARTAVVALGGRHHVPEQFEIRPGLKIAPVDLDREKTLTSDALLTAHGLARAGRLLERAPRPRIVILGGAHSAYSVVWALLQFLPHIQFAAGEIAMVSRRPPRIFYETRSAAEADSYAVTGRDICPRTRRVNRLGGLRGNGRDMWRRISSRQGVEPEPRVAILDPKDPSLSQTSIARLLDDAALIVTCFGYRARTVPIFDPSGRRLPLRADRGGSAVGPDAHMALADGTCLPNVFGIGLGSGFVPTGSMGGEPSFDGQANSLWLYQNHIGGVVYRGIHRYLQDCDLRSPVPVAAQTAAASAIGSTPTDVGAGTGSLADQLLETGGGV